MDEALRGRAQDVFAAAARVARQHVLGAHGGDQQLAGREEPRRLRLEQAVLERHHRFHPGDAPVERAAAVMRRHHHPAVVSRERREKVREAHRADARGVGRDERRAPPLERPAARRRVGVAAVVALVAVRTRRRVGVVVVAELLQEPRRELVRLRRLRVRARLVLRPAVPVRRIAQRVLAVQHLLGDEQRARERRAEVGKERRVASRRVFSAARRGIKVPPSLQERSLHLPRPALPLHLVRGQTRELAPAARVPPPRDALLRAVRGRGRVLVVALLPTPRSPVIPEIGAAVRKHAPARLRSLVLPQRLRGERGRVRVVARGRCSPGHHARRGAAGGEGRLVWRVRMRRSARGGSHPALLLLLRVHAELELAVHRLIVHVASAPRRRTHPVHHRLQRHGRRRHVARSPVITHRRVIRPLRA